MKKEIFKIFLLLVIFVISLSTLFLTLSEKSAAESTDNKRKDLMLDLYYRQTIEVGVLNNNFPLKLSNDSIVSAGGKRTALNIDSPVLIYKYSAFSCGECVEFGLKKIEESIIGNGIPLPIMVISDYPKSYQPKHEQFLNLGKRKLGIPLEETSLPFYFILLNGEATDVFVPEKRYPEYTDVYLTMIKKKHFEKKSTY